MIKEKKTELNMSKWTNKQKQNYADVSFRNALEVLLNPLDTWNMLRLDVTDTSYQLDSLIIALLPPEHTVLCSRLHFHQRSFFTSENEDKERKRRAVKCISIMLSYINRGKVVLDRLPPRYWERQLDAQMCLISH